MPRRFTNLALLGATATLLTTGVIAWLLPASSAASLYSAHRIAGIALVLALVWKYGIATRSLARRGLRPSGAWIGLGSAFAAAVAILIGLLWSVGLVSFDRPLPYSLLNVHVIAGLATGVLLVVHVLVRGESRPALVSAAGRRAALRALGLLAVSLAATTVLDRIALLPKRASGSRHAGSFTGNAFPVTIWSFDSIPQIDPAQWRLNVGGAVSRPVQLSLSDLATFPHREMDAVLDCTGGWWTEQKWAGVSLRDVLDRQGMDPTATQVEVISVTGHRWTFDREGADRALLATAVGGEPLSPGHGYPVRLVAPDLRGFLWIKWVGEVVAA